MLEILLIIDGLLCVISIFALAFFCAVFPKTEIAQYFYILFGVTILPLGVKSALGGDPWYEYIWFFLFAIAGIVVGIGLIRTNRVMNKEEKEKLNKEFGKEARRGGMRRLSKELGKMDK